MPRNVARAVVTKCGDVFFLSELSGEVPEGNTDGFGLYYHDCRYLNGYEVRLDGTRPNGLAASASRGSVAAFALTNDKLQAAGGRILEEQTLGISLERVIDADRRVVHDVWTLVNHDVEEHAFAMAFRMDAAFEDVFEIRGLHPSRTGRRNRPGWHAGVLAFTYDGADGIARRLEVHFDPRPTREAERCGEFELALGAGESREIRLSLQIVESRARPGVPERSRAHPAHVARENERQSQEWLARCTGVRSDSRLLNAVMRSNLLDLGTLKSTLDGFEYLSAGLPWYGALFGRDSIIAALQSLAYEPAIAAQTVRLLASYQGSRTDEWRDEEPGKILHELRTGELANLNEIPQTPYYGSVDSTPLFLILLGEHANWTGSLDLFHELRENVERALRWIDEHGMDPETGYLAYASKSIRGLGNQGWKDSGVSVMNADGSLATPPIALVEVQGYVHRAKRLIAGLYERSGDRKTAERLRREAAELRARFERDFWIEDQGFYAIALQRGGRRAEVVSSNPGQALWSGIVGEDRAAPVMRRLTAPDMFSGWGIRTLSRTERRYNPVGYHIGTVWPHDNALIAAGFCDYGFDEAALRVFDAVLDAAAAFEHHRLPEVFGGFERTQFPVPVRYPVACHPQAWAAGSVPFMLACLAGIEPDGFDGCLRVVSPVLPGGVAELEFRRLRVGPGTVDLRLRRTRDGVDLEVRNATGGVRVERTDGGRGQERSR